MLRTFDSKTARASISEKSVDTLGVSSRQAASSNGSVNRGKMVDFMARIVSRESERGLTGNATELGQDKRQLGPALIQYE